MVQSGRQLGSNSATAPLYINAHIASCFSMVQMQIKWEFAAHGIINHWLWGSAGSLFVHGASQRTVTSATLTRVPAGKPITVVTHANTHTHTQVYAPEKLHTHMHAHKHTHTVQVNVTVIRSPFLLRWPSVHSCIKLLLICSGALFPPSLALQTSFDSITNNQTWPIMASC